MICTEQHERLTSSERTTLIGKLFTNKVTRILILIITKVFTANYVQ